APRGRGGPWPSTAGALPPGRLRGPAAANADAALAHYTKALRGAARPRAAGPASPGFRRLASISYEAVRLRKSRDFGRAARAYRRSIAMQERGELPEVSEVAAAVAAAHTALNLALTEKALGRLDRAQVAFNQGCRRVQELMFRDTGARVDSRQHVWWPKGFSPGPQETAMLGEALRWLATLLTAWALLETQQGRVAAARRLALRAARFDEGKKAVLRWQVLDSGRTRPA
ncbi:unnamed protein product, partial [Prorocentrum cordatum]